MPVVVDFWPSAIISPVFSSLQFSTPISSFVGPSIITVSASGFIPFKLLIKISPFCRKCPLFLIVVCVSDDDDDNGDDGDDTYVSPFPSGGGNINGTFIYGGDAMGICCCSRLDGSSVIVAMLLQLVSRSPNAIGGLIVVGVGCGVSRLMSLRSISSSSAGVDTLPQRNVDMVAPVVEDRSSLDCDDTECGTLKDVSTEQGPQPPSVDRITFVEIIVSGIVIAMDIAFVSE